MSSDDSPSTSWSALFAASHRATVTVAAGGVALFATNVYVTTSLLPSLVADIGGRDLYAWTMTCFLFAAVVGSLLVARLAATQGPRRAYLGVFAVFTVGSLGCALAPTMPVLLVARVVQGAGAGVLAGLAYVLIRGALPGHLWPRALALVAAMWGVGNVIGPIWGGVFAELGLWRWAFGALAAVAVVLALVAARALKPGHEATDGGPVPVRSLAALLAAVAAISVASITDSTGVQIGLLVAAVAALGLFVAVDRATPNPVLPALTYAPHSTLKWLYLGVAALMICASVETFIPLFGQQFAGMGPLLAGLLGAAISWGWSVAAIASSGDGDERRARWLRPLGPAVVGAGLLVYGALQVTDAGPGLVAAWFVVLFVTGLGIGGAFLLTVSQILRSVPDDSPDAEAVSAGVTITQLVANAFGAAITGFLVNLGGGASPQGAMVLTIGLAVIAVGGVAVMVRSRPARVAVTV